MKMLKYFILVAVAALLSVLAAVSCIRGGKLDSIIITPDNPIIAIGTKQQFKATAHFTDGTALTWTSAANWTSSNPDAVAIGNVTGSFGVATSLTGTGAFTIIATDPANGIEDSTTLIVAEPDALELTPANAFMAIGTTHQFIAAALFSNTSGTQNLSSFATWKTTVPSVATVSGTGLVTANTATAGSTELVSEYTFTDPDTDLVSRISDTTIITITETALDSITVTSVPAVDPLTIMVGQTMQFIAMGNYPGSTATRDFTQSVSWTSSDSNVANISNIPGSNGFATGISTGTTIITATDPITNKLGSITLTIQ